MVFMILGLMLLLMFLLINSERRDRSVDVIYGYPKNSNTWLTLKYYPVTNEWEFEWDDLFVKGRPKDYPQKVSLLYLDKSRKKDMTKDQIKLAWKLCKQRGYT